MGTHLAFAAFTTPALDAARVHALFDAATAEIVRIEKLMTTWDPASEVSRINAAAGQAGGRRSATETFDVIREALHASEISERLLRHHLRDAARPLEVRPGPRPASALGGRRDGARQVRRLPAREARRGRAARSSSTSRTCASASAASPRATPSTGRRRCCVDAGAHVVLRAGGRRPLRARHEARRLALAARASAIRAGPEGDYFAMMPVSDHAFSTAGDYERSLHRRRQALPPHHRPAHRLPGDGVAQRDHLGADGAPRRRDRRRRLHPRAREGARARRVARRRRARSSSTRRTRSGRASGSRARCSRCIRRRTGSERGVTADGVSDAASALTRATAPSRHVRGPPRTAPRRRRCTGARSAASRCRPALHCAARLGAEPQSGASALADAVEHLGGGVVVVGPAVAEDDDRRAAVELAQVARLEGAQDAPVVRVVAGADDAAPPRVREGARAPARARRAASSPPARSRRRSCARARRAPARRTRTRAGTRAAARTESLTSQSRTSFGRSRRRCLRAGEGDAAGAEGAAQRAVRVDAAPERAASPDAGAAAESLGEAADGAAHLVDLGVGERGERRRLGACGARAPIALASARLVRRRT